MTREEQLKEAQQKHEVLKAEMIRRGLLPKDNNEEEIHAKRPVGQSIAMVARNIISGLGDQIDFYTTPVSAVMNLGAQALGSKERFGNLGESIARGIDNATGEYTAPQTKHDKITESMERAVAGLGVDAATGSYILKSIAQYGPKIMNMAPSIIEQIGRFLKSSGAITPTNVATTAVTSGMMQHHLNENPNDTIGAIAWGIASGLLAGGGTGLIGAAAKGKRGVQELSNEIGANLGNRLGIQKQKVQDFKEAGVNPLLADVGDGKVLKALTNTLEYIPWVGSKITRSKEAQQRRILEGLGVENALERKEAGELATKGIVAYKEAKDAVHSPIFEKIDADIAKIPDLNVDINNVNEYKKKLTQHFQNGLSQKKFDKSPIGKIFPELQQFSNMYNGKIRYYDLKETLDTLIDLTSTKGLIGKSTQGKLEKLKSSIAADIQDSIGAKLEKIGGDALENWENGRSMYRSYILKEVPDLNEIFKQSKKTAVDALENIITNSKKGGNKLKLAMDALPIHEREELIFAYHKKIGSQGDGPFNIAQWATNFNSLSSHTKKVLLAPLNKDMQKKMLYIAKTTNHLKKTLAEANSSKTSYHSTLGKIISTAGAAGAAFFTGDIWTGAQIATGLLLGKLGAEAITNPKIINWAYKAMQSRDLDHFARHVERLAQMRGIDRVRRTVIQKYFKDIYEAKENNEPNKK